MGHEFTVAYTFMTITYHALPLCELPAVNLLFRQPSKTNAASPSTTFPLIVLAGMWVK